MNRVNFLLGYNVWYAPYFETRLNLVIDRYRLAFIEPVCCHPMCKFLTIQDMVTGHGYRTGQVSRRVMQK